MNWKSTSILLVCSLVAKAHAAGTIKLLFYDRTGREMTVAQVRATSTNDGKGYENDFLLDPVNLHVLQAHPFKVNGDRFEFELPDRPAALALNWPTEPRGYSLILLDNGGKGFSHGATVNFTYRAALDVDRKLEAARRKRRDYQRSKAFIDACSGAHGHLAAASASSDEAVRGKEGQLALDDLAVAYDLLLSEHGPARAAKLPRNRAPWIGFTIDTTKDYTTNLDRAAELAGRFGWIRIVFDRNTTPADYRATVSYAKSKGLKIMGQPVDSSYDKHYSRKEYVAFAKSFIDSFPEIDAWEVGNEVNGGWLSRAIDGKIADVAAYCKSKGKTTVLTLFWQMNTCDPRESICTWADACLPSEVRRNLDVVTISLYCEQAPMGVFFDQLMEWMRRSFPMSRIGIGELGYWIPEQRFWWAYDRSDPLGKAMTEVARQFYGASLDYEGAIGGCFWWNFIAEFRENPGLGPVVSSLRDRLSAGGR